LAVSRIYRDAYISLQESIPADHYDRLRMAGAALGCMGRPVVMEELLRLGTVKDILYEVPLSRSHSTTKGAK
jgi:hypothetical protein